MINLHTGTKFEISMFTT